MFAPVCNLNKSIKNLQSRSFAANSIRCLTLCNLYLIKKYFNLIIFSDFNDPGYYRQKCRYVKRCHTSRICKRVRVHIYKYGYKRTQYKLQCRPVRRCRRVRVCRRIRPTRIYRPKTRFSFRPTFSNKQRKYGYLRRDDAMEA